MNQLIIRRNNRERIVVICPLCFWAALTDNLIWMFGTLYMSCFPSKKYQCSLGNSVFRPRHMSLSEMLCLILRQLPLIGRRNVHRRVCITVKNYLIYVDVTADAWITDPRIFNALAFSELSNSPELRKLPRWMRKEIRRKGRQTKVVFTNVAYEYALTCSVSSFTSSGDNLTQVRKMIRLVGIASVDRCLIWKGASAIARSMNAREFKPWDYVADNRDYLVHLHPVCVELLSWIYGKSRLLSAPVLYMLIAIENRYPCFFYTEVGTRLLSVLYAEVGLIRILRSTGMELGRLAQQFLYLWQGTYLPVSFLNAGTQDGIECPWSQLLPQNSSPDLQIGSSDEQDLSDDFTGKFPEPTREVSLTEDAMYNEDMDNAAFAWNHLHSAGCGCKQHRKMKCRSVVEKSGSASQGTDPQENNDQASVGLNVSAAEESGVVKFIKTAKNGTVSNDTEYNPYAAIQKTFAPAYMKVTGAKKAPLIVPNAGVLDNSKKSNRNREINRYRGNIAAMSVEASMKLIDLLFPGFYVTDLVEAKRKGEKDIIYLHTNSSEITCPCCGKKAKKVKDANTRTVQDLSLRNGIGVELKLTVGRAFCENPECANFGKCFYEQCPFAQSDRTYTTRVQYLALVTGTSSSFHDTERQMRLMGIQFGDDCVKRLLMSLQFPDEKDVTVIGMDDVSIRKGQSYCTIIYNMKNGHMLKLIRGRSGKAFQRELHQWLEEHPNVTIVCRDRATSYGCYIDRFCRLHPERKIAQVADRFHLMQNLSGHLQKAFYSRIPNRIALKTGENGAMILEKEPTKVALPVDEKPTDMHAWHYDNTQPLDDRNVPICFDVYVDRTSEKQKLAKMEENRKQYEEICRVRQDYEACGCRFAYGERKKFLEEHGINDYFFNKYIKMTQEELDKLLHNWEPAHKAKLFDNYQNLAYKMLRDGRSIMDVFYYIKEVVGGWDLSDSTLIDYLMETYAVVFPGSPLPLKEDLIRMEYPDNVLVVGRQRLFYALLTLDPNKQDKELAPYMDLICNKYPVCEMIRSCYREFHDIIIVDRDINKRTPEKCAKAVLDLQVFIEKHAEDELGGFSKSLKQDINCVTNAITMRENSGGVEGRNCKYKEVLRSCYGHISLETLEQKLKLGFMYTGKEFSFAEVCPWLIQELPA